MQRRENTVEQQHENASLESLIELEKEMNVDIPVDELFTATLVGTDTTNYSQLSTEQRETLLSRCVRDRTVNRMLSQSDKNQKRALVSPELHIGDLLEDGGVTIFEFEYEQTTFSTVVRTQTFNFEALRHICGADSLPKVLHKEVPLKVDSNGSVSIQFNARSMKQVAEVTEIPISILGTLLSVGWIFGSALIAVAGFPILAFLCVSLCAFFPLLPSNARLRTLLSFGRHNNAYMSNFESEREFFERLEKME